MDIQADVCLLGTCIKRHMRPLKVRGAVSCFVLRCFDVRSSMRVRFLMFSSVAVVVVGQSKLRNETQRNYNNKAARDKVHLIIEKHS